MSHYYDRHPQADSQKRTVQFDHAGRTFVFHSDAGVFSKGKLDEATRMLLQTFTPPPHARYALDLGCGYGAIGIVLSCVHDLKTTLIDVNERALTLAEANAKAHGVTPDVRYSDGFSALEDECFDVIVTNPPIRIGKTALYPMLEAAADHLTENGELWIVVRKKQGARSLVGHLRGRFSIERMNRRKGIHVYRARPLDTVG